MKIKTSAQYAKNFDDVNKLEPSFINFDIIEDLAQEYYGDHENEDLSALPEEKVIDYYTKLAYNFLIKGNTELINNRFQYKLLKENITINFHHKEITETAMLLVYLDNKADNTQLKVDILLNGNEMIAIRVFSLFHEVGHYLLHVIRNSNTLNQILDGKRVGEVSEGMGLIEREANRFSANALVNLNALSKAILNQKIGNYNKDIYQYDVDPVANYFVVSNNVIKFQVQNHANKIYDNIKELIKESDKSPERNSINLY